MPQGREELLRRLGRNPSDPEADYPSPWTSATANIPPVKTQPIERKPVTTPGMQGMIPPDAQLRSPTQNVDAMVARARQQATEFINKPIGEKWGRVVASSLGLDWDQLDEMRKHGILMQLILFHGSPHLFEKFDVSKIGTGEGAQAFGHGIYFAENPETAAQYHRNLASFHPGGIPQEPGTPEAEAAEWVEFYMREDGLRGRKAYDAAIQGITDQYGEVHGSPYISPYPSRVKEVTEAVKRWRDSGVEFKRSGGVYAADVKDAHIAQMLDWDKPLSQQPQAVQDLAKKALPGVQLQHNPMTGADLYRRLVSDEWSRVINEAPMTSRDWETAAQKGASDRLRAAGVPGLRYLDRNSRVFGKGTSNFVVFDPESSIQSVTRR